MRVQPLGVVTIAAARVETARKSAACCSILGKTGTISAHAGFDLKCDYETFILGISNFWDIDIRNTYQHTCSANP
jgi:hypothetical protein